MKRVAVVGAAGQMGVHVLNAVAAAPDLTLGAALEHSGHPELGKKVGPNIALSSDLAAALENCDVTIDFSSPDATLAMLREATPRGIAQVIATTGFEAAQQGEIEAAAQSCAIVQAANFSLGVNALIELVERAAAQLPDYDLEVLEIHHNRKVDAPSGTALRLGEAAASARGQSLRDNAVYHREGQTGPRPSDSIGMQTLRGGDTVGEHTVFLVGPGERIELTHRALSRDNFATGASRAAAWACSQGPGLYSMQDVLSR